MKRSPTPTSARVRGPVVAAGVALAMGLVPRVADAQRSRPRFEPTDLDLHERGEAEADLQLGPMKGDGYVRGFAPDFELSLGVAHSAELEVDGTIGFNHAGEPAFLDNTLVAVRLGLFDVRDGPKSKNAWAGGLQVGPRLPTLPGARGIGLEALAILGRSQGRLHVFLQAGSMVDCAQVDSGVLGPRPTGIEVGADLDLDLDDRDKWSLKGEIASTTFLSPDDDQLQFTLGPAYRIVPSLELSAIAFVGALSGGDRLGILLGAAQRF